VQFYAQITGMSKAAAIRIADPARAGLP